MSAHAPRRRQSRLVIGKKSFAHLAKEAWTMLDPHLLLQRCSHNFLVPALHEVNRTCRPQAHGEPKGGKYCCCQGPLSQWPPKVVVLEGGALPEAPVGTPPFTGPVASPRFSKRQRHECNRTRASSIDVVERSLQRRSATAACPIPGKHPFMHEKFPSDDNHYHCAVLQ